MRGLRVSMLAVVGVERKQSGAAPCEKFVSGEDHNETARSRSRRRFVSRRGSIGEELLLVPSLEE